MKKVTGLFFSKLCLIGATLFFSIISNAQVEQTARYERDHKYSDPELTILPMYENGMALIHDKEKYNDGKKLWQLIVLDTDLKETMSLELATEPRLRLVGYDYKDDLIYLLFRSSEHEGSDLNLVTIDSKTQEIKRFTIKQELTFKVTHFSVLSRAVILGGYVNKDPAILIYDLQTEFKNCTRIFCF
jgi:hypothetical protein